MTPAIMTHKHLLLTYDAAQFDDYTDAELAKHLKQLVAQLNKALIYSQARRGLMVQLYNGFETVHLQTEPDGDSTEQRTSQVITGLDISKKL